MAAYGNDAGVMTDHGKMNTEVTKVKDGYTVVNMYICHGQIIRDLDTGKNWRLKTALKEQGMIGQLREFTDVSGHSHILTAAT